jgi:hypothetical protein
MSSTRTGEYFMWVGVARRIARRLEEDTVSPQVGIKHVRYRTGSTSCKPQQPCRRIARRMEEDNVSPQVGRKHVRYRDWGVLRAGWSSPEVCREAGGRYRLPTGGQKTCQVQGPGSTSCGPE